MSNIIEHIMPRCLSCCWQFRLGQLFIPQVCVASKLREKPCLGQNPKPHRAANYTDQQACAQAGKGISLSKLWSNCCSLEGSPV